MRRPALRPMRHGDERAGAIPRRKRPRGLEPSRSAATVDPRDVHYMQQALAIARDAAAAGEVPVGAIVVRKDEVIGRGGNRRETASDPMGHAEIDAIAAACQQRGDWRLNDCTLYVTLEPCPMCAGTIVNARLGRLVYGAADPKAGAVRSLYRLCEDRRLNHRVSVTPGVLAEVCGGLLTRFFRARRGRGG